SPFWRRRGTRVSPPLIRKSQLTRNQASASALNTIVRTATPTTRASSIDQVTFLRASIPRGGSISRNGTTSMGALGAELELEVLRDSTPFGSLTPEWPGRASPSARRAVDAVTGWGVAELTLPMLETQPAPSFSSGTRSRLRSAEL